MKGMKSRGEHFFSVLWKLLSPKRFFLGVQSHSEKNKRHRYLDKILEKFL